MPLIHNLKTIASLKMLLLIFNDDKFCHPYWISLLFKERDQPNNGSMFQKLNSNRTTKRWLLQWRDLMNPLAIEQPLQKSDPD